MLSLKKTIRRAEIPESVVSQIYHLIAFKLKKPKMQLEKGMFIISIDIDVGCKILGIVNNGKMDAHVNDYFSEYTIGKIEETALPIFVDMFENLSIPVTFAVRGQLPDVDSSTFELLLDSSVKHDIGSHGYFHRKFENLSHEEAEKELIMISEAMRKFGVIPKSFIFPANSVAHLNLLEKYGYKCYRSWGNFLHDSMYIEKRGSLYDIHPSMFIHENSNYLFLERILDVAVAKKAPVHFWFHLWNFGETKKAMQTSINREILPLLKSARKKADSGMLSFETMFSAAKKIEGS